MSKVTPRKLGDLRLGMMNARRTLTSRADFVGEIGRLWDQSLEAMTEVGRRLNEAKEALPHGDYEAMVEGDLPFSPATARKLRTVAAFVDSGIIPADRLPGSYSTVFELATLSEAERAEAVERGLVGPQLRRSDVLDFKAEIRGLPAPEPTAEAEVVAELAPEVQAWGPATVPEPPAPAIEPESPAAPASAPETEPPRPAVDVDRQQDGDGLATLATPSPNRSVETIRWELERARTQREALDRRIADLEAELANAGSDGVIDLFGGAGRPVHEAWPR